MAEMTAKEAKDYLLQIKHLDAKIESIEAYISNLNDSLLRITQTYRQDVVTGGSSHDRMSSTVAKIVDLKTERDLAWDMLITKRDHIMRQLDKVRNPDYLKVLQLRYIEYKTFDEIALEMHYSHCWICRLHGRALQTFAKIMNQELE